MSEPETGPDPASPVDPPAPPPAPRPAHAPLPTGVSPALAEFGRSLRVLTPRGFVTEGLIAINVLVFAIMVIRGVSPMEPKVVDLLAWGAGYGPKTTSGQWWRLFTATFLHIGFIHLAMNMYVLWNVGPLVERMLGNAGFLLLYVTAGLTGSMASVAWNPNVVSAGASGAVFGVYGCLLGFLVVERRSVPREALAKLQRSAFLFVGYNMIFGLSVKGIDMAAHLGGLAGGFVGGLVLAHPLDAVGASRRWMRDAILAVGATIVVVAATQLTPRHTDVQPDLEAFGAMETRTMSELRRVFKETQDGTMTDEQGAELIEKQILPGWQASHQKLAAAKGLPDAEQAMVKSLLEYMSVREEAFGILAEGARAHDEAQIQRGIERYGEADALARAMNEKKK